MSIKSTESTTLDVGPDFSESDSSHIIERFFQAAKDLDCKELDYILSVNSKLVNTKDDDNRTALHIVFQKGIGRSVHFILL
jgi:ankyrin repeat protein